MKRKYLSCVPSLFVVWMLLSALTGCKKDNENTDTKLNPPGVILDSVMDVDSNYYPYTKIGSKYWMTRDLKVLHFRDGTTIPLVSQAEAWRQSNEAACCYFSNVTGNKGLLYNGYVLSDVRQIAPEGWHIATEQDWNELEEYIGLQNDEISLTGWRGYDEARKIKLEGRKGWEVDENTWPDNYYKLSLTGNGGRLSTGQWADPGLFSQGFWWSATAAVNREDLYYFRHLDYKSNLIFREASSVLSGYAIRCVKD